MADKDKGFDIDAAVSKALAGKDASEVTRELLKDNRKQRDEIRELSDEVDDLKPYKAAFGEAPIDGAVVLTKDQAAAWAKYQELGKPEDLKTAVEERDGLRKKVSEADHRASSDAAAEAAGYKAEVLAKLPGASEATFEVRTETVEGKEAKVAYVTPAGDDGKAVKLTDYTKEHWKEFLPALTKVESESPTPTPFPHQSSDGSPAAKSEQEIAASLQQSGNYGF